MPKLISGWFSPTCSVAARHSRFTGGLFSVLMLWLFYAVFLAPFLIRLNKQTSLLSMCKTLSSSSHTGHSPLLLSLSGKRGPFWSGWRILGSVTPQLLPPLAACDRSAAAPSLLQRPLLKLSRVSFAGFLLTEIPVVSSGGFCSPLRLLQWCRRAPCAGAVSSSFSQEQQLFLHLCIPALARARAEEPGRSAELLLAAGNVSLRAISQLKRWMAG